MIRLMAALALTAVASAPAIAAERPTMAEVLRSAYAMHGYDAVRLSPDATAVAWVDQFHPGPAPEKSRPREALYVQKLLPGAAPIRITAGAPSGFYDESEEAWSPDGKQIAFLSDARTKEQDQLFIADADGTHVRQLGTLDGNAQNVKWSPSGTSLAVLYIRQAHRQTGALAAGARDVGVIGSVVDEQRLATVDVSTGALHELTPNDVYVYEYGWSPDGRRLACTFAHGNGDDNWWVAKLATVDAASGDMHTLLSPSYQINDPQWSPDGKWIAVIGGIMSDFGSVGGDVYLVDPDTGAARNATPQMPASARSLHWADATGLDFVAHVNGATQLMRLDLAAGAQTITALTHEPESIASWTVAKSNVFAMSRQSFDKPPAVWVGTIGALKLLAGANANAAAPRYYGQVQSLSWKSDAFTVQGWLVYPLGYDASKRYPMVTIVHGGPSAQSTPSFGNRNLSALASSGYFVFEPNPRGSFGQGEAFTAANVKDFGYGDWRDDLAGVDAALKAAPVDPNRLGLFGWSYGGYMGMWAETQTTRFKAIVAGAGIVSWQSYYGQNKIDQWMIPFFGASVYDDPAVYAKSSPITFIKNSKTPVLILQGERDEEVPAPQAFEFWHAMQALGVPTQLQVYADEGHGPQKPENQIDILTRTVGWFDKYLGG
jgi:dipeptidyl aminopeptidase/acylaminoacyl peptidase